MPSTCTSTICGASWVPMLSKRYVAWATDSAWRAHDASTAIVADDRRIDDSAMERGSDLDAARPGQGNAPYPGSAPRHVGTYGGRTDVAEPCCVGWPHRKSGCLNVEHAGSGKRFGVPGIVARRGDRAHTRSCTRGNGDSDDGPRFFRP